MKQKIEKIVADLLRHNIGKNEAVDKLTALHIPDNEIKNKTGTECTCHNDEIFYDKELEIIWCCCGKLFANENKEILAKAGLSDYPEQIKKIMHTHEPNS